MEPILIGTTVWVDWFRGTDSPQTQRLASYLSGYPVWTAPIIIQETLLGVRDDWQCYQIQTSLLALEYFQTDAVEAAIEAAYLYRALRKQGITIRKANDCLIAHNAISADMILLHNDSNFDLIASCSLLKARRF